MYNTVKIAAFAVAGLVAGAMSGPAHACDHWVDLVNRSSQIIETFQASNSEAAFYGRDRLGTTVLRPGYHIAVYVDDGSGARTYDFRLTLADGRVIYRDDVDVCSVSSYTLYD